MLTCLFAVRTRTRISGLPLLILRDDSFKDQEANRVKSLSVRLLKREIWHKTPNVKDEVDAVVFDCVQSGRRKERCISS